MPLAVLVAGDLVSGRRPQPPAPSVTLNPIRTRWMEHLGRRPPCLRIMPFRTSCGRPDPAAGAVCGGHDRVFPALSRPRLSPWSRCRAIRMVIAKLPDGMAGTAPMMAMTANRRATDSPRMPQAVPKRIHTRSPGRPGKPIHYRRTTPSPLLCGAHNKGEHIVRGEVGSIAQSSLQGMAMGLRSACCISRLFAGVRTAFGFRNIAISALIERMSMAWHLRHAQGRGAHSAGKAGRRPRKLRQPPDQAVRIM